MSDNSGSQYSAQTADLGIDELRLIYDREESRNNTFESKAAALFGFSSIILSILIFTLNSVLSSPETIPLLILFGIDIPLLILFGLLNLIGIFIIFRGLIIIINVLKIRNYMTPFAFDPNEIRSLLLKPSEDLKNYIIEDYRRSIPYFYCLNDNKAKLLKEALKWLKIGIFLSIIPLIVLLLIKIIGVA